MDELLDMIISDESPSKISDGIKNIMFTKSAEKIESLKPSIANSLFGQVSDSE